MCQTEQRRVGALALGLLSLLLTACGGGDGGGGVGAPTSPSSPIKAWGAPTLIAIDTPGYPPSGARVAVDAIGNAQVVWWQSDGTHSSILASGYSASTGLWSPAAPIETDNTGDATHSQVAIDATGNGLAVWTQFDGTRTSIWANRYSTSTGWGVAAPIETDNAESAADPQVTIDATGNALAVWQQFNGPFGNIWANRYSASSGLWGVATPIDNNNPEAASNPQVAIDAAGNGLAVWIQSDSPYIHIWANRYSASTGWGIAARIENHAWDAEAPQIAIDTTGNAMVVWQEFKGSRTRIWANRYSASTGLWGTAAPIKSDSTGDTFEPRLAIDATGNVLAVWSQYDGIRVSLWANHFQ